MATGSLISKGHKNSVFFMGGGDPSVEYEWKYQKNQVARSNSEGWICTILNRISDSVPACIS